MVSSKELSHRDQTPVLLSSGHNPGYPYKEACYLQKNKRKQVSKGEENSTQTRKDVFGVMRILCVILGVCYFRTK